MKVRPLADRVLVKRLDDEGPGVQRERFHWAESLEQARFMISVYRERAQDAGTGK